MRSLRTIDPFRSQPETGQGGRLPKELILLNKGVTSTDESLFDKLLYRLIDVKQTSALSHDCIACFS